MKAIEVSVVFEDGTICRATGAHAVMAGDILQASSDGGGLTRVWPTTKPLRKVTELVGPICAYLECDEGERRDYWIGSGDEYANGLPPGPAVDPLFLPDAVLPGVAPGVPRSDTSYRGKPYRFRITVEAIPVGSLVEEK